MAVSPIASRLPPEPEPRLVRLSLGESTCSAPPLTAVGDAGVRAVGQQEKLFVGMILILIFAEALGLYGLIVALILSQQSAECTA